MRARKSMVRGAMTLGVVVCGLLFGAVPALAAPEAPVTSPPTQPITASSTVVEGTLNPGTVTPHNSVKVGGYFAFSNPGGSACNEGPTAGLEGFEGEQEGEALAVHTTLGGLQPDKNYVFCLVASNEAGETAYGNEQSFATAAIAPTLGAESVTALKATAATLNTTINPNNQETTYEFEYATEKAALGTAGAMEVAGKEPLLAEFSELQVSVNSGVLQPRTLYFYRVVATNASSEKEEGAIEEFTTPATPIVTTGEAQEVTRSTATFSGTGTVNPGGIPTTYHIAYVPAAEYEAGAANPYINGRTTPESESIGADYTSHATSPVQVSELKPSMTYDYALVASNAEGTTIGPNESFTTGPPTPPLAETGAPVAVSQSSGTITGAVNTRELPTTEEFEFGSTPYSDAFVPAQIEAAGGSTVIVAATLSGTLQPGTTYYYRVIASNPDGAAYGAEQSFTIPGYPPAFAGTPAQAFIPYTTIAELNAKEAKEDKSIPNLTTTKALTRAQKLAKALKSCRKDEKKSKRAQCEATAHKRFGPLKKSKKPKKARGK